MNIKEAIKTILKYGNRPDGTPAFHASPDFVQRSQRIYIRNKKDPGDCEGDDLLLVGLSIAEAHIGTGPGWIPEVQKYGVHYAEILEIAARNEHGSNN
jgi:hypothetical protein